MPELELVSHHLCPYVQRAAIVLAEKGVPFRRVMIDLSAKPDWFLAISPLGKVPLLRVGDRVLFESAAICDYLEEVHAPRLHPADPIARAEHRAWIGFASNVLDEIAKLYSAPAPQDFDRAAVELENKFERLEMILGSGPYFAGVGFSMVDAAFAAVFRYFDVLENWVSLGLFASTPKKRAWRRALQARDSVRAAVDHDYPDRLTRFFKSRNTHLSSLIAHHAEHGRVAERSAGPSAS